MVLNAEWMKATDWVLARFTRPPAWGRWRTLVVIGCLILIIGLADYVTDIRISLTAFYFVPVLLAVAWLGWREAIAVSIGTLTVRVVGDYEQIEIDKHENELPG